jgi:hypothetical protein
MVYISSLQSLQTLHIDCNWTTTIPPDTKNDRRSHGQDDSKRQSMTKTASPPQLSLPHLVDLKTPSIPLSLLDSILTSSCNTLRSLSITSRNMVDDHLTVIMNAKLTHLTSLSVLNENCSLPLSLTRFPNLRHLSFARPSSIIKPMPSSTKAWLLSTFSSLSSSSHLEDVRFSNVWWCEEIPQVYDLFLSLPSVMTINGEARDKWLGRTKKWIQVRERKRAALQQQRQHPGNS